MLKEQQLPHVWRVWLSFSSGKKSQANYEKNLIRLYQLKNWVDLAYLWTQSEIKNPNHFFANPQTGQYTKFEIEGEMRKIESINFMKDDREPTWQYGDNSKGGYYDFILGKEIASEVVGRVFEQLVFMALGESVSEGLGESVIGVRVVDTSSSWKKNQRCRFEIWVDYADSDDMHDVIKKHSNEVQEILSKIEFNLTKIKFSNFKDKMGLHEKKDKDNLMTQKKV